jgi:hypothetical protein
MPFACTCELEANTKRLSTPKRRNGFTTGMREVSKRYSTDNVNCDLDRPFQAHGPFSSVRISRICDPCDCRSSNSPFSAASSLSDSSVRRVGPPERLGARLPASSGMNEPSVRIRSGLCRHPGSSVSLLPEDPIR